MTLGIKRNLFVVKQIPLNLSLQKFIQFIGIFFGIIISVKMCGNYYAEKKYGVGANSCKIKWIPFAEVDESK